MANVDYDNLKEDINEIKLGVSEIRKVLNGKDGLVTTTELNKASIKKAWWWLSAVSLSILGIAFFIIRGAM